MRKLATAAAVSLVLASGGVRALGLGDIEMRSALNQPMSAEIRLTSVQPGEAEGMIVQLASADEFARAGIERTSALTDLSFSVDRNSGSPVIRISSKKPIVEPFLNFLLEVDWPAGRMVREYTVLLDPPVFLNGTPTVRNNTADQAAVLERSDTSLLTPVPIQRDGEVVPLAETFDEGSVVVLGTEEEIANNAVLAPDLAEGELVTLDDLLVSESIDGAYTTDVDLLDSNGNIDYGDTGEVVTLSDLGSSNPEALEQYQQDQLSASDFNFNVEVVGSPTEVNDDYIVQNGDSSEFQPEIVDLNGIGADGSELVSLEELDVESSYTSPADQEVTVRKGDTLLSIAKSNSIPGVSPQQMMLALLNANQKAFINNNVNLVKAGAILRIPQKEEVQTLTQTQAIAQLGEQNQLWQEYRDQVRSGRGVRAARPTAPTAPTGLPSPTPSRSSDVQNTPVVTNDTTTPATPLTKEAQRILDSAREEVRSREELRIVAAGEATDTTVSATADKSQSNVDAELGKINRKIQLAKEEFASTQLESTDLSEQSAELQDTSDNLEALVSVRQNEIARLEAQLKEAQLNSEAGNNAATSEIELLEKARAAAENAAKSTQAGAENAVNAAKDAASGVVNGATGAVQGAADSLTSTANDATASAQNALTQAGETLGEVELIGDEAQVQLANGVNAASTVDIAAPVKHAPWYQEILAKFGKWIAFALAAICGLIVSWLLFFKKRRNQKEEMLDYEDDVEFFDDDDDDVEIMADSHQSHGRSHAGMGAAAAAGVGAAGVAAANHYQDDESHDDEIGFGDETRAAGEAAADTNIDADDTMAEVDVYLAYGLHGQAEELLLKGLEQDPNNSDYSLKLLETYHAQGNVANFSDMAEDYSVRFGTAGNPDWPAVAAMGHELQPQNVLFTGGGDVVESVGRGDFNAAKLDDEDFYSDSVGSDDETTDLGSVGRNFSNDNNSYDSAANNIDESHLMDESLDPGHMFDEADLEATGDFSAISNELVDETQNMGFSDFENDETELLDAPLNSLDRASDSVSNGIADFEEDVDNSLDFPDFDADKPSSIAGGIMHSGKESLSDLGDSIGDGVDSLGNMGDAIGDSIGDGVDSLGHMGDSIGDSIGDGVDSLGHMGDSIGDSIGDGVNALGDGVDSVASGVVGGAAAVAGGVAATAVAAKDKAGDMLDDALSFDEFDVNEGQSSGSLNLDSLDDDLGELGHNSLSDDLTLDLDQLAGDVEFESGLLDANDATQSFEMPDLTSDNDLLSDDSLMGDSDEMDTMMDLAKAYIDMGDKDSASSALDEIVKMGTPDQVSEAETLLRKIS